MIPTQKCPYCNRPADAADDAFDGRWLGAGVETPPLRVAGYPSARDAFASLWDSINAKKSGAAWADNPFVWAISFERMR